MKKDILVCEYKNNLTAKKSRVFYTLLIDYFLTVIVTFIVFIGILFPILNALPFMHESNLTRTELRNDLYEIINETRLQTYDKETNTVEDINVDTNEYILSLVKTSYYIYDLDFPYDSETEGQYELKKVDINETFFNTFDQETNIYYLNDNLMYYFMIFKSEHQELNFYTYGGHDYSSEKTLYFYRNVIKFNSDEMREYFIPLDEYNSLSDELKSVDRFNVLSRNNASLIVDYLIYENELSNYGGEVYNNLAVSYQNACQTLINEVESYYSPYINTLNKYNDEYSVFVVWNMSSLSLAYMIAFILVMVISPLVLKKNRTIGVRVLKLGYSRIDEFEPTKVNILLKNIAEFILYYSGTIFSLFFIGLMEISTYNIFNSFFNFFNLIIFSILLDILSLIYLMISKDHQTISLLLGKLVIKDLEKFEGGVALEETIEEENKEEIKDE